MELAEFRENALTKFTKEITDIFFCYIESDTALLQDYLRVIGREGDLDSTNMALGKGIKEWFGLKNDLISDNPKSKLIKSYTQHISPQSHISGG
jgi:thiaminase